MSKRTLGVNAQTDPASSIALVTKSDTVNDTAGPFRGIMIGGVGIVKITTVDGDDVELPSGLLAVSTIYPIHVMRVWSTTTTATDIYGLR
jgi:hypothetical protein